MKHTLLELVDAIVERIQAEPDRVPSERGLRLWLRQEGYSKKDIDAAIKLVGPRYLDGARTIERHPGAVRHLSHGESQKLTTEARDALVRLDLYELITPGEREAILDRLHTVEGQVGLDELDYLLSWVVYGVRDVEHQQTVFDVLEGRGNHLH